MRKSILAVVVVLLAFSLLFGCWHLSRSRTVQLFGDLVHRIETEQPIVALTFDDGPTRAGTARVLHILDSLGVKATFFVTGSEVLANLEQAREIHNSGHELGNHSFSHPHMVLKSPRFVRQELEKTDSLIQATGQEGGIFFRPPYAKKLLVLPWVLARTGRKAVTWDVEPETPPGAWQDSQEIVRHALEGTRPGSIILLHVMYPSRKASMDALPEIITQLRSRGFEFLTVGELVKRGESEAFVERGMS